MKAPRTEDDARPTTAPGLPRQPRATARTFPLQPKWPGAVGRLLLLLVLAFSLGGGALTGCVGAEEKAEKKRLESAEFHYKMGAGYFDSKEIALAIRELTQALELNPDIPQAHYLLGFIYMGRRDYTKATRHFKEVLRLEPSYHPARNNLGAVYLATERWRDAVELYGTLLDEPLYATPELAHNNIGWAKYQLRRYSEALEHLRMAIFLKPQFCLGYNNLGLVYRAMGNRGEAQRHFRKAIERCPQNYAEPHFNLGKLLQEEGHRQARAHFARCAQIQPHSNLAERCRQYVR